MTVFRPFEHILREDELYLHNCPCSY